MSVNSPGPEIHPPPETTAASIPILGFRGVSKSFGSVVANRDLHFTIEKGTIHAFIGENGAGKSTCAKMIFGIYKPDSGEIFYKGTKINFTSPVEAKLAGIGMVHQHFMLAGPIPAVDHIFLDEKVAFNPLHTIFGLLDRKKKIKELEQLSEKYKMPVPWAEPIDNLSVGVQQRIEILKILYANAELLIFDEPTAVLTPLEIEGFLNQLRDLKSQGKTIIIITHKMSEVQAVADKVTIFNQGKVIGTHKVSDHSAKDLAEMMVGHALLSTPINRDRMGTGNHILSVRNLSLVENGKTKLDKLTFFVRQKEIVGIAGVEGNGQSELLNAIIRPKMYGKNLTGVLDYKDHAALPLSPEEIRIMGLAFIPEDRIHQGLAIELSAEENFILGHHRSTGIQKFGYFLPEKIRELYKKAVATFDIRPTDPEIKTKNMSGGNQQKLLLSKELMTTPDLLVVAQPTRGVDIGAAEKIHNQILNVKADGGSVLLISSDLDELKKLCDRMIVMYNGKAVGMLYYYEFDDKKIGALMGGFTNT